MPKFFQKIFSKNFFKKFFSKNFSFLLSNFLFNFQQRKNPKFLRLIISAKVQWTVESFPPAEAFAIFLIRPNLCSVRTEFQMVIIRIRAAAGPKPAVCRTVSVQITVSDIGDRRTVSLFFLILFIFFIYFFYFYYYFFFL